MTQSPNQQPPQGYYGPTAGPQSYGPPGYAPLPTPKRSALGSVPKVFWAALIVGVVAFAAKVSIKTETSGSIGNSCSYHNYAGYLAAGAIVVLVIVGWATRAATRPDFRRALPLMTLFTAVLLALAVLHVLRGTGSLQSACPRP